jgi:hypothetical protein
MPRTPVVLLHGSGSSGHAVRRWAEIPMSGLGLIVRHNSSTDTRSSSI